MAIVILIWPTWPTTKRCTWWNTLWGMMCATIDYKQIPGCTYTHPQVASMGLTEKQRGKRAKKFALANFRSVQAVGPWRRVNPMAL